VGASARGGAEEAIGDGGLQQGAAGGDGADGLGERLRETSVKRKPSRQRIALSIGRRRRRW